MRLPGTHQLGAHLLQMLQLWAVSRAPTFPFWTAQNERRVTGAPRERHPARTENHDDRPQVPPRARIKNILPSENPLHDPAHLRNTQAHDTTPASPAARQPTARQVRHNPNLNQKRAASGHRFTTRMTIFETQNN